jgi:hypothetical protein
MSDAVGAARKNLLSDRMVRPALLDASVYAELLNDSSAALIRVLLLTSAAAALGHAAFGIDAVVAQFAAGLVLWLIGLGIVRYLVTADFATYGVSAQQPDLRDLAVVLAYANTPRTLFLLLVFPLAGGHLLLAVVFAVAILALTVTAVSQAINTLLDVDPRSAGSIALVANTPAIFSYLVALVVALTGHGRICR